MTLTDPTRGVKLRRLWLAAGYLLVGVVIYLSLIPAPPQLNDWDYGDKLNHLAAYAGLMYWFAQAHTRLGARLWQAAGLVLLGVALEFAQGLSGYREFDGFDMIANGIGIVLGWLLAAPRTPNLLSWARTRLLPGAGG